MKKTVIAVALVAVTMPVIVVSACVLATMAIEWPEEDDM